MFARPRPAPFVQQCVRRLFWREKLMAKRKPRQLQQLQDLETNWNLLAVRFFSRKLERVFCCLFLAARKNFLWQRDYAEASKYVFFFSRAFCAVLFKSQFSTREKSPAQIYSQDFHILVSKEVTGLFSFHPVKRLKLKISRRLWIFLEKFHLRSTSFSGFSCFSPFEMTGRSL